MDRKGEDEWFNEEIERRVGDGATTSFWKEAWRGGSSFMVKYNRLFTISNQQDATVVEMREGGSWGFCWRCRLFVWEETLLTNLLADFWYLPKRTSGNENWGRQRFIR